MTKSQLENKALKLSIYGSIFMAVLGMVFAQITESDAILLDGFYSLIGFIMALLTVKVARMAIQPDDTKFNFGYAKFEPLLNTIKGLLILVITIFACIGSIDTLFSGGRELVLGWAIVYSVIASLGCFLISFFQNSAAKKTGSNLLEVDSKNWIVDGAISSGVTGAFIIALFIQDSSFDFVVPYVDSVLVILISIFALPIPVKILKESIGQLLYKAPDLEVQKEIKNKIDSLLKLNDNVENIVRLTTVGRYFYINVYLVVDKENDSLTIDESDQFRELLDNGLKEFHPNVVVDLVVTKNKKFAF